MSKGVKLLAALMDDEVGNGHKLMGAARMLAGAVSDLLRSVEPAAAEVRLPLITVVTWTSSSTVIPVATEPHIVLSFSLLSASQ